MNSLLRRLVRRPNSADNAQNWCRWLDRYGPPLVILARWFGPIRTVTILGAGAAGMNFWSYLFYSAIGAFSWTTAWQWIFWQFTGLAMTWWQRYREHHLVMVLAVSTLILVVAGVFFWRRGRKPVGDQK